MRSRSFKLSLLALLAACATENSDGAGGPEDLRAGLRTQLPSAPADFTDAELSELADSPAVKEANEPFRLAPGPDESLYVSMSDGVRLALDLYYPAGFDRVHGRAPTAYVDAWYSRGVEATATAIELYRASGFVVAIGDARGFGASFGAQPGFLTEQERADQKEMIAWLAARPWSDGSIAAVGLSLSGAPAEAMAASGADALGAAVIRANDFDQYAHNMFPGGIPNPRMFGLVAWLMDWMHGEPCISELASCAQSGFTPVDADLDLTLLQAALREHAGNVDGHALEGITYRDDTLGGGGFDQMSPADHLPEMRSAALPARVSASWLDGVTALGALTRFNALPEVPMEVFIGATTHSGALDADPFSTEPFQPALPNAELQYRADVAFAKRALSGGRVGHEVNYYVLGSRRWKRSEVWPPRGVRDETLLFSRQGLVAKAHAPRSAERSYQVDPTTSSRTAFNRWASQQNAPIYYGDRRDLPGTRLSFDTTPLSRDLELVGAPELCLALRSDQSDGLVIAYLEDVAPDGRVTYLTEGELRLLHRKTQGAPCDPAPGTARSFARADAAPVTPGELMQVELPLLPVAALLRKGHRLRLSLAGADAGTFPLLSDAPATWSVGYGRAGSSLRVPLKAWSQH
jgi:putative CocE/NonD family hydrolase